MELRDKVAIVTGGARGIGKEICRAFLEEGAVLYIFDVDKQGGNKTVSEFKSAYSGSKVNFFNRFLHIFFFGNIHL